MDADGGVNAFFPSYVQVYLYYAPEGIKCDDEDEQIFPDSCNGLSTLIEQYTYNSDSGEPTDTCSKNRGTWHANCLNQCNKVYNNVIYAECRESPMVINGRDYDVGYCHCELQS